nr:zinc finger protein 654-like [Nerophis lumbriciformis]
MADSESDVETDGLELALESLCTRYCSDVSSLKSKDYCAGFCELVEAYTSQWQVPLPQLKVLQTALCGFTKATAKFPDDCQHVNNILSRLALSIFELLLFFSKEEFGEKPLKDILDSYQACHAELRRYRNVYLQHAKLIIKNGGPWEHQVLQAIMKETDLCSKQADDYLSSELPIFMELRIRYLQACERLQEAMALAKVCLENHKPGKQLFFHQAYLTCLYKASLHDDLHKQMAQIDGHDAVEIICNSEQVEKDELLLSLCKAFLVQQLQNGDMYYLWDLVFIWSRLHLRAHPSRQNFMTECSQLAASAKNVRAIFPFIKLVFTELSGDGVQVCVELCAQALQMCDAQADEVAQSLVCKTIAYLLPGDLEICRACALLVFCLERSLEAYRTVRLLYKHPDLEPHPHHSLVPTSIRFKILQMLKGHLSFDPEFWSILALRTRCLELINDQLIKDALINEMREEEEEEEKEIQEYCIEHQTHTVYDSLAQNLNLGQCEGTEAEVQSSLLEPSPESRTVSVTSNVPVKKRKWRKRLQRKVYLLSDEDVDQGDDPEFMYNLKPTALCYKSVYSLRCKRTRRENCTSVKLPLDQKKEYLSQCVKSQILRRKGKNWWLQGVPKLEAPQTNQQKLVVVKGKKRGRKPAHKWELSYPDNEIFLPKDESGLGESSDPELISEEHMPLLKNEGEAKKPPEDIKYSDFSHTQEEPSRLCVPSVSPAVEANAEFDESPLELESSPSEFMHNYCVKYTNGDSDSVQPTESAIHGDVPPIIEESEKATLKVKVELTWREKMARGQKYAHLNFYCSTCKKSYRGLNVLRHLISHFKKRNKCIICGKRFQHFVVGKKHIWDHIEEMCNNHKNADATNGTTSNQAKVCNKKTTSNGEPQKRCKSKVASLSREDRIIRNLRAVIKKMKAQSKKLKNGAAEMELDFKDEQVVIQDSLLIIKAPAAAKEDEAQAARENGYDVMVNFTLCPSLSCDRVFLRPGSNLTKHAVRCHINEDEVLDKTFIWAQHKCTYCLRNLQFLQYYKEHIRRHDPFPPHFCYHASCDRRFLTVHELKEHIATHNPFSPTCAFANCEKQFSNLMSLFDHEWRHYIPVPQRDEQQKTLSGEAPWKQRIKVEEIWQKSEQVKQEQLSVEKPADCLTTTELTQQHVNGVEEAEQSNVSTGSATPVTKEAPQKKKIKILPQKTPKNPLNVKNLERVATLSECVHPLGEPVISEHKSFNPQEFSYAPFNKMAFSRVPPSIYMDESQLSMRKRRTKDEEDHVPTQSCSFVAQKDHTPKKEAYYGKYKHEQKIRYRCEKCLSSFSSVQELQEHKALNTCSPLFGFDSDDES